MKGEKHQDEYTSVTKGRKFPSKSLHLKSLDNKSTYWNFLCLGSCCRVVPRKNTSFTGLQVVILFKRQSTDQEAFQPNQEVLGRLL